MKIIIQLIILTLPLLLVNADRYCDNLLKVFKNKYIIKSCCELKFISTDYGPSGGEEEGKPQAAQKLCRNVKQLQINNYLALPDINYHLFITYKHN